MRPIDADSLKYRRKEYGGYDDVPMEDRKRGILYLLKDDIDNAPTIEPETADWISVHCESYLKVICSKCGHEPIDNEDGAFYWLTPYCPFCGRKIVRMNFKD